MFLWDSFVGQYTMQQLSNEKQQEVREHYDRITALNQLTGWDLSSRYDVFWIAFTMADLGILPLLGPKTVKWFYVAKPTQARMRLVRGARGQDQDWFEKVFCKVVNDIEKQHGIPHDVLLASGDLPWDSTEL